MTRRFSLFACLVALVLTAGCDTADDRPDEERIMGTRAATSVNARAIGISVPVIDLTDTEPESTVEFTSANAFRLSLSLPDSLSLANGEVSIPLPDAVTITGSYALDTDTERVTITRTDIAGTLTFRYAFRGSDGLELIAEDEAAFAALLGVLAGPQYEALAGAIDGGSIRFDS